MGMGTQDESDAFIDEPLCQIFLIGIGCPVIFVSPMEDEYDEFCAFLLHGVDLLLQTPKGFQ